MPDVTDTMRVRLESGEIATDEGSATIQLMVIPDGGGDDLAGMVDLQDVEHGRRELTLEDDAVIVSKSAANALGVKSGDTVSLTDGNMRHGEVTVTAVNRSVIGSDVYIGESAYRQAFDDDAPMTWNAVYAHYEGSGDEQVEYAEELQDDPVVLTAISCEDMRRSFRFELMAAVVALIIGLAGGLALVVLFTLANTNVSERVREMATLKVLGFTDREVHTYVNKEMMILTGVGIVAGLPLWTVHRRPADRGPEHAEHLLRGRGALVELPDRRGDHAGVRAAGAADHQPRAGPHRSGQLAEVGGIAALRCLRARPVTSPNTAPPAARVRGTWGNMGRIVERALHCSHVPATLPPMAETREELRPRSSAAGTAGLDSVETLDSDNEMERGLSNRHVQFIAIGGTIGTGPVPGVRQVDQPDRSEHRLRVHSGRRGSCSC